MQNSDFSRKDFLKLTGIAASTALGVSACKLNSIPPPKSNKPKLALGPNPRPGDNATYLGNSNTGLINFLYVLAQLGTAYYTKVVKNPYTGMSDQEKRIFSDIRDHGIAHRDFYNVFLGKNSIHRLTFPFSTVDFSSRSSVLNNAINIEDTSLSFYNIAPALTDYTPYAMMILKMGSVQGRQAAAVRIIKKPNSDYFINSSIKNSNGLDVFNTAQDTLNNLYHYIKEKLDVSDLPPF